MVATGLRLGVVCTYPPSRDAQSAYAGELVHELARDIEVVVCAVDRHRYGYPDEVAAVIREGDIGDFRRAADILAERAVDAVLVHDQGWVGTHHLLDELRRSEIPSLVALPAVRHDAPPDVDHPEAYRRIAALAAGADRLLVRTDAAARVLDGVAGDLLRVVPVGIPVSVPRVAVRPAVLDALDGGLRIVSTVGSIRPGRGIETVITGLPDVVANRPDVRYVVAGAVGEDADAYRDFLHDLVAELDLGEHVVFLDTQLTAGESAVVLDRTLVHVLPRLEPERTCSATLVRGLVAGCPTVAGLHPYAAALLAGGAGTMVRPGDPGALALAIGRLLDDADGLAAARSAAVIGGSGFSAATIAPRVAGLVREVMRPRLDRIAVPPLRLPSVPPADSARIAAVAAGLLGLPVELLPSTGWSTAAGWVAAAVPRLASTPSPGESQDVGVGRALWALSRVAGSAGVPGPVRARAATARDACAQCVPDDLTETAFSVLGLAIDPDPAGRLALRCAAARLNAAWQAEDRSWPWFTERIAPEGARLPQALVVAATRLEDDGMLRRGLEALEWYARRIGLNAGGSGPGGPRGTVAGADPLIEAGAVIEAYVEAYRATGSIHYGRMALRVLGWFAGHTDGLGYLGAVLALWSAELVDLAAAVPVHGDLAPAA